MPATEATIDDGVRSYKSASAPSTGGRDRSDDAEDNESLRAAPTTAGLRERVQDEVRGLLHFVEDAAGSMQYEGFERELITRVFRLARLLIVLFLWLSEQWLEVPASALKGRARYRRQPPKGRWMGTFFGKVRYWRTYMHQTNGQGGGFYPLDEELGLTADGFSFGVLGRAVLLATKMSFAAAAKTMRSFLGWSPSTKTIEQATLGLGRHTEAWFEQAPPPEDDGEVLIAQFDGKGTPTATEGELKKRRGKRKPNPHPESARHRGRAKRRRRGSKKRRKKGDKSKNAKMTTLATMYTLRRTTDEEGKPKLLGPFNRWTYGSYAPKRHAVAIARREANKRGFTPESGKTIQVLTDGDEDLERVVAELFSEAIHTPDVIHCVEYVWKAGACLYKEGSKQLQRWVEARKQELYEGHVWDMLEAMNQASTRIRSKRKRKRYAKCLNYLSKRADRMNYAELAEQDLELSTGMIEGAVRYVVSQRFDEGGMRWIRERAEALLQLRCIQINGHWDQFIAFAHQRTLQELPNRNPRLLRSQPAPLPTFGLTA